MLNNLCAKAFSHFACFTFVNNHNYLVCCIFYVHKALVQIVFLSIVKHAQAYGWHKTNLGENYLIKPFFFLYVKYLKRKKTPLGLKERKLFNRFKQCRLKQTDRHRSSKALFFRKQNDASAVY